MSSSRERRVHTHLAQGQKSSNKTGIKSAHSEPNKLDTSKKSHYPHLSQGHSHTHTHTHSHGKHGHALHNHTHSHLSGKHKTKAQPVKADHSVHGQLNMKKRGQMTQLSSKSGYGRKSHTRNKSPNNRNKSPARLIPSPSNAANGGETQGLGLDNHDTINTSSLNDGSSNPADATGLETDTAFSERRLDTSPDAMAGKLLTGSEEPGSAGGVGIADAFKADTGVSKTILEQHQNALLISPRSAFSSGNATLGGTAKQDTSSNNVKDFNRQFLSNSASSSKRSKSKSPHHNQSRHKSPLNHLHGHKGSHGLASKKRSNKYGNKRHGSRSRNSSPAKSLNDLLTKTSKRDSGSQWEDAPISGPPTPPNRPASADSQNYMAEYVLKKLQMRTNNYHKRDRRDRASNPNSPNPSNPKQNFSNNSIRKRSRSWDNSTAPRRRSANTTPSASSKSRSRGATPNNTSKRSGAPSAIKNTTPPSTPPLKPMSGGGVPPVGLLVPRAINPSSPNNKKGGNNSESAKGRPSRKYHHQRSSSHGGTVRRQLANSAQDVSEGHSSDSDDGSEEEMTIEDVERLQILLALKKRELARKKRRSKGHTRGRGLKASSSSKLLGVTKTNSSKELNNSAKALASQLEQEMEVAFAQNAWEMQSQQRQNQAPKRPKSGPPLCKPRGPPKSPSAHEPSRGLLYEFAQSQSALPSQESMRHIQNPHEHSNDLSIDDLIEDLDISELPPPVIEDDMGDKTGDIAAVSEKINIDELPKHPVPSHLEPLERALLRIHDDAQDELRADFDDIAEEIRHVQEHFARHGKDMPIFTSLYGSSGSNNNNITTVVTGTGRGSAKHKTSNSKSPSFRSKGVRPSSSSRSQLKLGRRAPDNKMFTSSMGDNKRTNNYSRGSSCSRSNSRPTSKGSNPSRSNSSTSNRDNYGNKSPPPVADFDSLIVDSSSSTSKRHGSSSGTSKRKEKYKRGNRDRADRKQSSIPFVPRLRLEALRSPRGSSNMDSCASPDPTRSVGDALLSSPRSAFSKAPSSNRSNLSSQRSQSNLSYRSNLSLYSETEPDGVRNGKEISRKTIRSGKERTIKQASGSAKSLSTSSKVTKSGTSGKASRGRLRKGAKKSRHHTSGRSRNQKATPQSSDQKQTQVPGTASGGRSGKKDSSMAARYVGAALSYKNALMEKNKLAREEPLTVSSATSPAANQNSDTNNNTPSAALPSKSWSMIASNGSLNVDAGQDGKKHRRVGKG